MKKFLGAALVFGILAVFAGCTISVGGEDTTTPATTTTTTPASTTSTTSTSSTSGLSTDWPADVIVNPDWEVTGTSNSSYEDSVYITKTQSCESCTKDEVLKYYRDTLTAQGWSEYSFTDSSSAEYGDSISVSFEKGDSKYVSIYYSVWDYLGTTIDISYSEYTY